MGRALGYERTLGSRLSVTASRKERTKTTSHVGLLQTVATRVPCYSLKVLRRMRYDFGPLLGTSV